MSVKNLKQSIIDLSHELGFQKIGFARAEPIPEKNTQLNQWLEDGFHAEMAWLEKRRAERGNLNTYFPGVRTIVSLAMNYFTGSSADVVSQGRGDYHFSNYAWGRDYHDVLKTRLTVLKEKILNQVGLAKILVCVDTAPVMEKVWAQRAGIGWQGKNTNLITREFGSWFFLCELILDIEIEPDQEFTTDHCGSCRACLDACPTGALEPYRLDSRKCISYLTIEHRGEIPEDLVENLDGWIYGCDVCQEVCPWNMSFAIFSHESAFSADHDIRLRSLTDWEKLSPMEFKTVFAGSPVKRTKFTGFQRNVALAVQNRDSGKGTKTL